jgi:hypothetical protein
VHNFEEEEIIWNFDNVQKAYATRGYEANVHNFDKEFLDSFCTFYEAIFIAEPQFLVLIMSSLVPFLEILLLDMLTFRRYSTVSIKFSTKCSQMQFCLEKGKSMRGDNSFLFSSIIYNLWNIPRLIYSTSVGGDGLVVPS